MFRLPDSWVWDFWFADDGEQYHLFFLYASRALHDPDARHYRASIGHAVSVDLRNWERVTDALVRGDAPAFDDLATWTGSIVRHPDGTWFMFYTGSSLTELGNVQRIGLATSSDLYTWTKNPTGAVLEADPQWYEKITDGQWPDEAFRDPWVLPDPDGNGWHMLITARANHGPRDDRGVVGHATSPDLRTWTLRAPLSEPGQGFGQLEVTQVEIVDGRPVLLFSCLSAELADRLRDSGQPGGVWAACADSLLGPYDIADATAVTGRERYVGRLVQERETGQWLFVSFLHDGDDGSFVGSIDDPRPFGWSADRPAILAEYPAAR